MDFYTWFALYLLPILYEFILLLIELSTKNLKILLDHLLSLPVHIAQPQTLLNDNNLFNQPLDSYISIPCAYHSEPGLDFDCSIH